MDRIRNFFISGAVTVAVNLLIRAAGVGLNAYISSSAGGTAMGLLTLTMSIYGFAVTFATSGINLAITRMVSEALGQGDGRRAGRSVRFCLLYSLFFGFAAFGLLYFGADLIGETWLGDARTVIPLKILSFSLVPISLFSAFSGYFTAVRRVTKSAAVMTLGQLARVGLTVYLFLRLSPRGIEYACSAVVLGLTLSEMLSAAVISLLYLSDRRSSLTQKTAGNGKIGGGIAKYMLSITLPVALSSYLRSALVTVEHILIPHGLTRRGADREAAMASYGVLHGMALPLVLFPGAIPGAFAGLIVPEVAERRVKNEPSAIRRVAERVIKVTLIFSVGVAVLLFVFADRLGECVYNNRQAGVFIRYFAPLVPVMYLDSSVDALLKGMGEQFSSMKINIIDAAFSVLAVAFLVPALGLYGYVITVFISETLNFILSIRRLTKVADFRVDIIRWIFVPALLAFASCLFAKLMLAAFSQFFSPIAGLCASVALSAGIYIAALGIQRKKINEKTLSPCKGR